MPGRGMVMGEEKKNEKITNGDGHVLTEAEIRRQAAFDEKEKNIDIICNDYYNYSSKLEQ